MEIFFCFFGSLSSSDTKLSGEVEIKNRKYDFKSVYFDFQIRSLLFKNLFTGTSMVGKVKVKGVQKEEFKVSLVG